MRSQMGQSGRLNESQDRFLMGNTAIVNDESSNDLNHMQESRDYYQMGVENSPTFVALNNSGIILPSLVKDNSRLDH